MKGASNPDLLSCRATEMDVTMIGLQNAGKSSLLRVLAVCIDFVVSIVVSWYRGIVLSSLFFCRSISLVYWLLFVDLLICFLFSLFSSFFPFFPGVASRC